MSEDSYEEQWRRASNAIYAPLPRVNRDQFDANYLLDDTEITPRQRAKAARNLRVHAARFGYDEAGVLDLLEALGLEPCPADEEGAAA